MRLDFYEYGPRQRRVNQEAPSRLTIVIEPKQFLAMAAKIFHKSQFSGDHRAP